MDNEYNKIFNQIVRKIRRYEHDVDVGLLRKAFNFAYNAHKDQLRSSGKPYFEHPIEVSKILIDLKMDIPTVCSGLMHDVAEDTAVTLEEIENELGEEIALLVDGVTKIGGIYFDSFQTKQAQNLHKIIIAMVKDIRIILIKFADRLHNMRTIDYLPQNKKMRIAIETRDVYAPLAHKLGLSKIASELEDHVLRILDFESHNLLEKKVLQDRSKRNKYIQKFRVHLQKESKKRNIFDLKIIWKPKHLYSIYKKMIHQGLPYEEINDRFTVLLIVPKVEQCYFVLGIVHKIFIPVHDRFKDYIATPKSNMYQSLHTTVIGPDGKMVEIQIRTEEMDKIAEEGIIAHWVLNRGKINEDDLEKHFLWLRGLLDWQYDAKDTNDFMIKFRNDLFYDEVFVFTPKGDLHRLPRGSTPVDFAFDVHSDIGYHCIAAKINRKMAPLNYQLRNGDVVEIITSNKMQPNPEWIKIVKTAKARNKIERWIKDSIFNQSLMLGKEMLLMEFERLGINKNEDELIEIAQSYGFDDINQLLVAIGKAEIPIGNILKKIGPHKSFFISNNSLLTKLVNHNNSIKIHGKENFLITFGECCQPIPGDRILGFISKGKGVIVHRADCKNIISLLQQGDTNIEVEWDVDKSKQFLVKIKIFANKYPDYLKNISESISTKNANINSMVLDTEDTFIRNTITLEVKNLNHLTRIMNKIRHIEGVISVDRIDGEHD